MHKMEIPAYTETQYTEHILICVVSYKNRAATFAVNYVNLNKTVNSMPNLLL